MPEYPDITIYIERLKALVYEQALEKIRFASPFFLRTAQPPIGTVHGATVLGIERMGKRSVYQSTRVVLEEWTQRLRDEVGDRFPDKVTAFRDKMAVHGRYKQPCPDCGTAVQRIRYAANETNYCPQCQTGGRLFADRSMSRLLKKDWPRTLEELELRERSLSRNLSESFNQK